MVIDKQKRLLNEQRSASTLNTRLEGPYKESDDFVSAMTKGVLVVP